MSEQKKKTDSPDTPQSDAPVIPLAELIRTRYQKTVELRAKGIDPYPYKYEWTHYLKDVLREFEALEQSQTRVRV
ncbi:hypothetical protein GF420_10170, partial [candidate division GN15 bacterium]|nr:hypothetical protein [candidate division GN15 bacterium]